MFKPIAIAIAAFISGQAFATPASPLLGVWVEVNGPGLARIAPCSATPARLCATGLARQSGGAPIDTVLVMTDIRPDGANRWRGIYHDNSRKLSATLRFVHDNRVEMKVCLFILCQTASYQRS
jgi:uncharacterized protein (DUF2147 family)